MLVPPTPVDVGVKHLNPRQGITTRTRPVRSVRRRLRCVKHLNPRQGITTQLKHSTLSTGGKDGVKHLNPRQGITTYEVRLRWVSMRFNRCETPKSPPGDYNRNRVAYEGTYIEVV